ELAGEHVDHLPRPAEAAADIRPVPARDVVADPFAPPLLADDVELADDQRHEVADVRLRLGPVPGGGAVAVGLLADELAVAHDLEPVGGGDDQLGGLLLAGVVEAGEPVAGVGRLALAPD